MGDVSKAGWLNKLFIWRVVDFFASSLDTVGLAPGFGCDWNKRAVRNRDSNHIKIKRVEKEQEVFRASALKTAEKVLQENLHLVTGTVRIRSFTQFLQVFPSLTGSRPLLHRLSHWFFFYAGAPRRGGCWSYRCGTRHHFPLLPSLSPPLGSLLWFADSEWKCVTYMFHCNSQVWKKEID